MLDKRETVIEELESLQEVQPKSFNSVPKNLQGDELVYAFENAKFPGLRYGNGELFTDFASRVSTFFKKIVLQEDWSSLLIVAHDGVNRIILSTVASNFSADINQTLSLMGGFEQDTCCLNIIDIDVKDEEIKFSRIKAMNIMPDNPAKEGNYLSSMERIFKPYAHSYIN